MPKGEPINLIGHSYGGDTAATVAANSSRHIDSLTTIDPVSWFKPDFNKVKENTTTWINMNAVTSSRWKFDNIVAGIGGAWNEKPEGYADVFLNVNADHADFEGMLKATFGAGGK